MLEDTTLLPIAESTRVLDGLKQKEIRIKREIDIVNSMKVHKLLRISSFKN